MKFDVQEINHHYITRLVIFAVFLFKENRKSDAAYLEQIRVFVKRRTQYDIGLSVDVGPKMSLDEQRDNAIEQILNDTEDGIMNLVVVKFKTGWEEVTIQIYINQEEKYESYLYS